MRYQSHVSTNKAKAKKKIEKEKEELPRIDSPTP